jgi:Tfp pilus assembly protein PilF
MPRLQAWLMALSLMLGTAALYRPATRCDFVTYDDYLYVVDNPHVTSGVTLENTRWALYSGYAGNWHPLTWLSHMLDCEEFGLKAWGHHLSSVLLHALNAGLVFALLQALTGMTWRSLWVAAFFASHPLRVESVAWVSERKDVLSSFFGLLALLAYARYAQTRKARGPRPGVSGHGSFLHFPSSVFYLLSLFCLALGLISKPMLVTWPLVMLLLDYWPLRRSAGCGVPVLRSGTAAGGRSAKYSAGAAGQDRTLSWTRLVWEKVPFFILALAASVVTFLVQQREGAVVEVDRLPLGARVSNALISYCRYLGKLLWPTKLAVYYPHAGQWPPGKVLMAGGLLLGLSVLFWAQRRRAPFLLMGWLWFLGVLVPVIGLVQVGEQAMADRYSYLPSLGLLVIGVWGASELSRRWPQPALALWVVGGAAVVLSLALTRRQIGYWQDGEALFRHTLAVTRNNCIAHNNLGIALAMKGQIDEAIRQYQAAVHVNPANAEAHYNLGLAFDLKGQSEEAIREFQAAARLKSHYADAYNNLGLALGRKGQITEAIAQYQAALHWKPEHAEAHNNLGIAFYQQGRTDEAIREFHEALRLKPDFARARKNLEIVLAARTRAAPPSASATSP